MFLEILILIFVTVISEFGAYKWIRKIDRKERKRLQNWEFEYVEGLKKEVEELKNELDRTRNHINSNTN